MIIQTPHSNTATQHTIVCPPTDKVMTELSSESSWDLNSAFFNGSSHHVCLVSVAKYIKELQSLCFHLSDKEPVKAGGVSAEGDMGEKNNTTQICPIAS